MLLVIEEIIELLVIELSAFGPAVHRSSDLPRR